MSDEQYRREYGEHLVEQVKNGKMTRRQLLVRASVFGFSATAAGRLLAACGGSSASSSATPSASTSASAGPVKGGTIKVVIPPPLKTLDPVTIYDQGGIVLVYQIAEYLIDLDNKNALKPKLAESWSPNTKGDVWTFKLRQGVKFNDGSPFEAADVVASIERVIAPKSGSGALAALAGILSPGGTKAVDANTVQFNGDTTVTDGQFAHVNDFQTVALVNGIFSVTLGGGADNADNLAGIDTIDASKAGHGSTIDVSAMNDTVDVTHEFGHMLGNPEEYFTTDGVDYSEGGTKQPFRDPSGGIMNNPANNPLPRNYDPIKAAAQSAMGGSSCSTRTAS